MKKLGSIKYPAIIRVQDQAMAQKILTTCKKNDWHAIVGIEPDKPEDISDFNQLLNPREPIQAHYKQGRNESCVCGSGKKFKKCCLAKSAA